MTRGFTLIELVMAILILSVMTMLSFYCFNAIVSSWTAGMEMSDSMAQADYVMNQIESGLRSAYFSTNIQKDDDRGFQFEDGGEGENARDLVAWMKEGRAFVGGLKSIDGKTEIAEMPHRVMLYVEADGRDGGGGLMAKAWSIDFQPDEFDVEEDVRAFLISPKVIGMDCKVLKEPPEENAKEIKWEDEWISSNTLPYKVSVTLYLRPIKERDAPLAVTRDIEVPVWDVSQNPVQSGGQSGAGSRTGVTRPGGNAGARPGSGAGTGSVGARLPAGAGGNRNPTAPIQPRGGGAGARLP
jgi:prepilin-type N-terminal cleavage/methylation domain-containing protein